MPMVMIKCPKTGLPVSTGIALPDQKMLDSNTVQAGIKYPLCGAIHKWGNKDAFLEEKAQ
jgi:hypothetical protein